MSISFSLDGQNGNINLYDLKEMQLNGYVMFLQGILPCLRIGGLESYRLVPSEIDNENMNKKIRMMGDCHVRLCERLAMQNVGLLDYSNR